MSSQPRRPVWLTEEEARSHLLYPRWDAAPADAAEAARAVIEPVLRQPFLARGVAMSVLLALGYPRTEQA